MKGYPYPQGDATVDAEEAVSSPDGTFLRAMHEAVVCCDAGLRVCHLNPAAERLTGWSNPEARGLLLPDVLRTLDRVTRRPRIYPDPAEAIATGGLWVSRDNLLLSRTGREHLTSETIAPLSGADGRPEGLLIVLRDVTEKRPLQQQAMRAAALESLGVLAGGIAHDFNNLLTAILGNLSLARHDVPSDAASRILLDEAETACARARDLTRQLLTFASGGAPVIETTDLRTLAQQANRFHPQDPKVLLMFEWPDDALWAEADRGQMHQVFSHLFENAAEAMPDGGEIRVSARLADASTLPFETAQPGLHLEIVIRDNGRGIPPENLSRVFDPYFSTKRHGSGLGLAMVHSILRRHGGSVQVESLHGCGTTVRLCLPAAPAPPAPCPAPAPSPTPTSPLAHVGAKVLVMDDEKAICTLVCGILRRAGHEADSAPRGEEALEKYSAALQAGTPFDLVIMDLTIPDGMGGVETMRRLLEVDPGVTGIVSSGYSNDPVMADHEAYGFHAALRKPYRMEDLVQTVAGLLKERTSQGGPAATRIKGAI